jgi:prolipoprotein diacylglyceryltransferase
MGCAVVHDHIGRATDFVLAVDFPAGKYALIPAGGVHHDLGLYEALFLMPLLCGVILVVGAMKRRRDGTMLAVAGFGYAIPRFFLEYLRLETSDPRYLGFTPAQYFSMLVVAGCLALLYRLYVAGKFTLAPDAPAGDLPWARWQPRKKPDAKTRAPDEGE